METARTGIDNIEGDQWEEIPDDEERERALYAEAKTIAEKLAEPAPEWLAEAIVETAAPGIYCELVATRYSVERCVVAKKIQTARKALAVLDEALHDPHVMMQISRAWPAHPGDYHELKKALSKYGPVLDQTFAVSCDELSRLRELDQRIGVRFAIGIDSQGVA